MVQGQRAWHTAKNVALALEACSFGRRLSYRGCVSDESWSLTAILAGSGFATDLLFVALVDSIDGILARNDKKVTGCMLRCFVIADDVRFVVEGRKDLVGENIVSITDEAAFMLDDILHMQMSKDKGEVEGKTVALASDRHVAAAMAKGMRKRGIRVKEKVRNLGIDFGAGRARGRNKRAVLEQRKLKVARWIQRARRCGWSSRRAVIRTAVTLAISYGAAVSAVPQGYIRKLRAEAARRLQSSGG